MTRVQRWVEINLVRLLVLVTPCTETLTPQQDPSPPKTRFHPKHLPGIEIQQLSGGTTTPDPSRGDSPSRYLRAGCTGHILIKRKTWVDSISTGKTPQSLYVSSMWWAQSKSKATQRNVMWTIKGPTFLNVGFVSKTPISFWIPWPCVCGHGSLMSPKRWHPIHQLQGPRAIQHMKPWREGLALSKCLSSTCTSCIKFRKMPCISRVKDCCS